MIHDFSVITVKSPDRFYAQAPPPFPAGVELTANKGQRNGYAGLSADGLLFGTQQRYGELASTACEGDDSRLNRDLMLVDHNGNLLTGDGNVLWRH